MLVAKAFRTRPLLSRFPKQSCYPFPSCSISTTTRLSHSQNNPNESKSSQATATESKSSSSFEDPTRPGLYYHFVPGQNLPNGVAAFACSFLSEPPRKPDSSTILGYVPAVEGAGLHDFHENKKFLDLMHETIKNALSEGADDGIIAEAMQRREGWMHINDARNIPALGRIGDPDDIIASVRVDEGKIIAESYERMPAYRICTSDGLTTLSEGLAQYLQQRLQRQHDKESA